MSRPIRCFYYDYFLHICSLSSICHKAARLHAMAMSFCVSVPLFVCRLEPVLVGHWPDWFSSAIVLAAGTLGQSRQCPTYWWWRGHIASAIRAALTCCNLMLLSFAILFTLLNPARNTRPTASRATWLLLCVVIFFLISDVSANKLTR